MSLSLNSKEVDINEINWIFRLKFGRHRASAPFGNILLLGALYYVLPSRFFGSTSGVIEPQLHSEIFYCWVPRIMCCRRDFSVQLW